MENEESQNQPKSEPEVDLWNAAMHPAEPGEVGPEQPAPKDPNTTPTAELVADYEGLLEEIKGMKQGHDAAMAAYELRMKGASVEAAKLLVVISKRLGMPLNGAQPPVAEDKVTFAGRAQRTVAVLPGQTNPSPCPYCGKEFMNGLGMHIASHVRHGDKKRASAPSHHGQTRWCDTCGKAIGLKGWNSHQASHKRTPSGQVKRYGQSMADAKIREILFALRTAQPTSSKAFCDRYFAGKNITSMMTGLKERGLAINDETTHLWTVTGKGETYLKVNG